MQGTESARMQSTESRDHRECRVESTESARVRSREEGAECTMRAQCESTESAESTRMQRVRE
jgi:hypothetical protein